MAGKYEIKIIMEVTEKQQFISERYKRHRRDKYKREKIAAVNITLDD